MKEEIKKSIDVIINQIKTPSGFVRHSNFCFRIDRKRKLIQVFIVVFNLYKGNIQVPMKYLEMMSEGYTFEPIGYWPYSYREINNFIS